MSEASKQAQLRAERLAKALRANLGRRKSQARRRDEASDEGKSGENIAGNDAEKPQDETG